MSQVTQERPLFETAQQLEAASSRSWGRRLLIWGLRGAGVFVLLCAGFLIWVRTTCFASPPKIEGHPAILDATIQRDEDGRQRLGSSWFLAREGRSTMYLEGDPYSLGYANARLASDWMYEQEESLIATVREFLPSDLQFWGITLLVLTNNRSLPDYVPEEYQLEIRGLADGSEDPFPDYGPRYHRILNYHAAHDISHWVWDKPVIGCNALAARGAWTANGHLLVARNFDFEAGRSFDRNKIIALFRPEEGQAFLSVVWPGMAGAVTGLNDQRIYCSINGAHSADRGRIGTPSSLVVRRVLQYSSSLEEAIEIIRNAQVFVADSYLVADGGTGEAVVVEKTPAATAVRRMKDGLVLQSNHFESEELAADEGNQEYMRVGTSLARHARLRELTDRAKGELDPPRLVEIFRDRMAAGDTPLCVGNRGSLNAMIATHSIVADITAGVLWVSRGPHQLGEFDRYTIEGFGAEQEAPIPADPGLADGTHERLVRARGLLEDAQRMAGEMGMHFEAALTADVVLELVPGDPDALTLLAECAEAGDDPGGALDAYRRALAAHPPFPEHRESIEAAIERLSAAVE